MEIFFNRHYQIFSIPHLHQPVGGEWERGLAYERPELVQQVALRHGEVLRVYLGVELALDTGW